MADVSRRVSRRDTVRSETSTPRVRNSPWIRGAPHNGFAVAISRTRARISRVTGGRPFARGVERRVHRRRSHVRCQPTTVSGRTSTSAVRQFVQMRRKAIQNSRSRACKRGRLFARFIAISCCRSARFSRTSSRCPRSPSASARPTTINSWSMSRSWLARAPESTRTSSGEGICAAAVLSRLEADL